MLQNPQSRCVNVHNQELPSRLMAKSRLEAMGPERSEKYKQFVQSAHIHTQNWLKLAIFSSVQINSSSLIGQLRNCFGLFQKNNKMTARFLNVADPYLRDIGVSGQGGAASRWWPCQMSVESTRCPVPGHDCEAGHLARGLYSLTLGNMITAISAAECSGMSNRANNMIQCI